VDTIGHPDPLVLVAPPAGVDPDLVVEVARQLAGDAGRSGIAVAVLADDTTRLRDVEGVRLAVPTGPEDDRPYELVHGDGFGRHLEERSADLAHVRLAWNPGHAPEDKKAQAMAMARLAAWVHETDRKLLVELTVPPVPDDIDQVAGDPDRFRTERHPELVARSIVEIRDLGVEPDLWVVEPPADAAALTTVAEAATDAGRDEVALLLADGAPDLLLRAAGAVPGYRGVVVGASAFADPSDVVDVARARDAALRGRRD
jgi:myo-inositol catabolism protein IolC